MKRRVKGSRKPKVFNSLNIILIALVLLEVAFVVNEGVLTGQPVRSAMVEEEDYIDFGITGSTQTTKIAEFKSKYGDKWKIEVDNEKVKSINGFKIETGKEISDSNIDEVSKSFIVENKQIFKVDEKSLNIVSKYQKNDHGKKLNQIVYSQKYSDLPIERSYFVMNIVDDKIISVKLNLFDNIYVPTNPTISEDDAEEIAQGISIPNIEKNKLKEYPLKNLKSVSKKLVIFPKNKELRLAWKLEFPMIRDIPKKYIVYVDAQNKEVLEYENLIKSEISGTITGDVFPEYPTQNQVEVLFSDEKLIIADVNVKTDYNGFYFSGATGNVLLYSALEGPWVKVTNEQQVSAEHLSELVSPTVHNWSWKDYDHSYKNEESNVFYHINKVHDYMANPSLNVTEINFQMPVYVNYPSSCNAFYCGVGGECLNGRIGPYLEFFQPGPCGFSPTPIVESTALMSDVIYHEYTHGVVDQLIKIPFPYADQTGNMNEGWADYFACTINGNSCLSEGFNDYECLRNCDNQKRYPEDYTPEPHSGAEIVSGSLWDLREVLGSEIVDSLAIQAIRLQPVSFSDFALSMLIADDDNYDLSDGTPHSPEICHSFYDNHGIFSDFCSDETTKPIAVLDYIKTIQNNENGILIEITGTAYPSKNSVFEQYKVQYSYFNSSDPDNYNWIDIYTSSNPVVRNTLALWNLSSEMINEGSYIVRLLVKDNIATSEVKAPLTGRFLLFNTDDFIEYVKYNQSSGKIDKICFNASFTLLQYFKDPWYLPIAGMRADVSSPIRSVYSYEFVNLYGDGVYNITSCVLGSDMYKLHYDGEYNLSLSLESAERATIVQYDSINGMTSYYLNEQFPKPLPGMRFDDPMVFTETGDIFVGEPLGMVVNLINTGDDDIREIQVNLSQTPSLYSSTITKVLSNISLDSLPSSTNVAINFSYTPLESGFYFFTFTAQGKSNNTAIEKRSSNFGVIAGLKLADAKISLTTPRQSLINGNVASKLTITNNGYPLLTGIITEVYLNYPDGERRLISNQSIDYLYFRQSSQKYIYWETKSTPGTAIIEVKIKSFNDGYPENNEINYSVDLISGRNILVNVLNPSGFSPLSLNFGDGSLINITKTPQTVTLSSSIPPILNLLIMDKIDDSHYYTWWYLNSVVNDSLEITYDKNDSERKVNNLRVKKILANSVSWQHSYTPYIDFKIPSSLLVNFSSNLSVYSCNNRDYNGHKCLTDWAKENLTISDSCGNFGCSKSFKGYLTGNNLTIAIGEEQPLLCADLNSDGVRDILDVSLLINHAFRNGPEPQPKWIGDLDASNAIDVLDVVAMVNHVFRNGPEPTCQASSVTTSSSGTISLGSATGTTTKTIPVNLANSEDVAGTTFKVSYDSLKLYVKNIRTASRTSNMQIIMNGNSFTLIKQDGSQTISKGSGAIAYIDVTTGKAGFDTSSLKITEAKAANPNANKIAVSIGKTTTTKSGTSLN